MKALLGKKLGMTQFFNEDGTVVRCSVIQAGPCLVTQKKTVENDGYAATQIAFGDVKAKRLNKPLLGHLKKAGVAPKRHLVEVRGEDDLAVGDSVNAGIFAVGDRVKVCSVAEPHLLVPTARGVHDALVDPVAWDNGTCTWGAP